jgi:DNA-binding NarL/FixJ family response regulator
MISVVFAEDHPQMRASISALLATAPDIQVVGQAAGGREAVELTRRLTPDVLIVDMVLPDQNGLEVIRQISALGLPTKILVLSMYTDQILVDSALQLGASDYLSKSSLTQTLLPAVRALRAVPQITAVRQQP